MNWIFAVLLFVLMIVVLGLNLDMLREAWRKDKNIRAAFHITVIVTIITIFVQCLIL